LYIHDIFVPPGFEDRRENHGAVTTRAMDVIGLVSVEFPEFVVDIVQRQVGSSYDMLRGVLTRFAHVDNGFESSRNLSQFFRRDGTNGIRFTAFVNPSLNPSLQETERMI